MRTLIPLAAAAAILLAPLGARGQAAPPDPERGEILRAVDGFIDALNAADTVAMARLVDPNVGIMTVICQGPNNILAAESLEMLYQGVARMRDAGCRETQTGCQVATDGALASVWCQYTFQQRGRTTHRGANAYQLYKTRKGWRIIQVTDTRHKQ